MCSWSFGENSLAHHLPRREREGGRELFDKACTSAPVAGSREGACQTPSTQKREQRRRWRRRDLLPRVGGRANRPRSRGHSRPKILALLPDFTILLTTSGLRPNLYLVQLPRVPPEILGWALRPPGFTPRRRVLVTSFPGAGQWALQERDVFLRMGVLPSQFKFSSPPTPALVPSSPAELESLRPSPSTSQGVGPGWRAEDTRGDQLAGTERMWLDLWTSEFRAWSFRLLSFLHKSRGQDRGRGEPPGSGRVAARRGSVWA